MGETSQSILSLNDVFDFLKKKELFTLNVFKKLFRWLVFFLSIFFVIYLFFCFYIFILVTKSLLYFAFSYRKRNKKSIGL